MIKNRPGVHQINTEFSKETQAVGKKREQKHHDEHTFHFFMAWAFGLLFLMLFLSMIGA